MEKENLLDSRTNYLTKERIATIICFSLIALMLIGFSGTILHDANWVLGDDDEFITNTAIGKPKSMNDDIRMMGSRFFPLGHYDYNLTLLIPHGSTPTGHYCLNVIELVLSVIGLLLLFRMSDRKKLNRRNVYLNTFFLLLLTLISSSFLRIFMDIIFPERVLVLTLTLFMLFYLKGLKTQKTKYYVPALFFAVYSSYCKEPVFGIFIILALTNGIFGYKKMTKKDRLFNYALIVNGLVFLMLYYLIVYRNAVSLYNEGKNTLTGWSYIVRIFQSEKVLIVLFILGLIRGFYTLFKKSRNHLCYDGLLFAGLSYTIAFLFLRLDDTYYFVPAIILGLPSLVYWTKYLYAKKKTVALLILIPIGVISVANFSTVRYIRGSAFQNREYAMPFVQSIDKEHKEGKVLYWYEENLKENTIRKSYRSAQKNSVILFLSYINKRTTTEDVFVTINRIDKLGENEVFFYSSYNNDADEIPDEIKKRLDDSGFTRKPGSFGIAKYSYQP